jgi:hypothetical protein
MEGLLSARGAAAPAANLPHLNPVNVLTSVVLADGLQLQALLVLYCKRMEELLAVCFARGS